MSEQIRDNMKSLVSSFDVPASDLAAVRRRGRRRLAARMVTTVAAISMGGAVVTGAIIASLDSGTIQSETQVGSATGGSIASPVPNSRVATFAVRNMAQAGLLNPVGRFTDYQSVDDGDGNWVASFKFSTCDDTTTCTGEQSARLTVVVDNGKLRATEANGPFTEEERERLLAYRESPDDEDIRLEFPFVHFRQSPDEQTTVIASPLWTGPIPSGAATRVECDLKVFDDNGNVIFERTLDEPLPNSEEMRAGTIHLFGIPSEVRDNAADVKVNCRTI